MAGEYARSYSAAVSCKEITTISGTVDATKTKGVSKNMLCQWAIVSEGSGTVVLSFKPTKGGAADTETITVGVGTVLGGGFIATLTGGTNGIKITCWY